MADSTSSNSSSSSSAGSFIPNYPQSPLLMAISNSADQIAQQLYQWAQNTYANTSQLTDANVNQYLDASAQAGGLASNAIDRYQTKFQPQEDQLIKDANTYASAPRVAQQMGMAESSSMQATDAARQNALRDLQSYGIDPSSDRYASLDAMMRTQAGAAAAGAGQQAQLATEATGRQLRGQAIQVGQQYPGQAVNALNSRLQGIAGAENSILANANTGANLLNVPKGYLDTASNLKYPPLGNGPSSSGSAGRSQSSNPQQDRNQQQQDPNARGGNQGNQPGGAYAPQNAPGYKAGPATIQNPFYQPNASQTGVPDSGIYDPTNGYQGDYSEFNPTATDYGAFGEDPTGQQNYTDQGFGTGGDQQTYDDFWANYSDPNQSYSDSQGYTQGTTDYSYAGGDYGDSGWGGDYSYAKGGDVGQGIPTTGGSVDQSMSPSGGQQTDDVNAHLNVDEFVIPKDVKQWKGEEFFHKLIAQSRQNLIKARQTVHGTPGQARPGPAQFVSQATG